MSEVLGTAYWLAPLLGGALFHGLCLRFGWFAALARPIDAGRTFRGRPLFGKSKTYRGPIAVAAGSAAVFALQQGPLHGLPVCAALELVDYATLPGWWLAGLAGAAAELAELPNSFVKRRFAVEPSATARGWLAAVFFVSDQLDLLLGYWVAYAPVLAPTPIRVLASAAIALVAHPLLTLVGFALGLRRTAR